jgi:preprotein translocase subunit YajC
MSTLLLPLLIVLMVGMLYFGTRRQKRQQQQQQKMQNSLSYGDRVMTTSGMYGTVVSSDDESIDLEIADGIVTTWLRAAVREKVADKVSDDVADDVDDVDEDTTDTAELHDDVDDSKADEHNGTNGYQPKSSAELAPPLDHRN